MSDFAGGLDLAGEFDHRGGLLAFQFLGVALQLPLVMVWKGRYRGDEAELEGIQILALLDQRRVREPQSDVISPPEIFRNRDILALDIDLLPPRRIPGYTGRLMHLLLLCRPTVLDEKLQLSHDARELSELTLVEIGKGHSLVGTLVQRTKG